MPAQGNWLLIDGKLRRVDNDLLQIASWSPTDEHLGVVETDARGVYTGVGLITLDGHERRVYDTPPPPSPGGRVSIPAIRWSRSGRWLVIIVQETPPNGVYNKPPPGSSDPSYRRRVFAYDTMDGTVSSLYDRDISDGHFHLDDVGAQTVVLESSEQIVLVDIPTGETRVLDGGTWSGGGEHEERSHKLSPDESHLATSRSIIDLRSGASTPLPFEDNTPLSWSSDSEQVLVVTDQYRDLMTFSADGRQVGTLETDGYDPEGFFTTYGKVIFRDGRPDEEASLVEANSDGSGRRVLARLAANAVNLHHRRNDTVSYDQIYGEYCEVAVNGGTPHALVHLPRGRYAVPDSAGHAVYLRVGR